jgi:hypothetical protein
MRAPSLDADSTARTVTQSEQESRRFSVSQNRRIHGTRIGADLHGWFTESNEPGRNRSSPAGWMTDRAAGLASPGFARLRQAVGQCIRGDPRRSAFRDPDMPAKYSAPLDLLTFCSDQAKRNACLMWPVVLWASLSAFSALQHGFESDRESGRDGRLSTFGRRGSREDCRPTGARATRCRTDRPG